MTQEDKELLFKDLCARLPYGVKVQVYYEDIAGSGYFDETVWLIDNDEPFHVNDRWIENITPYLRPMSSMTEKEYDDMFHQLYSAQEEFFRNCSNADTIGKIIGKDMVIYDFLTKKMFDFRCLIPKGLALVAPEGMYN